MTGEDAVHLWLRRRARRPFPGLELGIGDDAAVIAPPRGHRLAITCDVLVEGIDFERRYTPLPAIGWKALAASISDVAAMGARPRWALASLALPRRRAADEARAILGGLLRLARQRGVALAGGDLSASPGPIVLDVTVLGTCRRALQRCGGRPGDLVAVSGPLGLAALGLERLRRGERLPDARGVARRLLLAQLRPDPDPEAGVRLAPFARAMMDVSDGLATDLARLCAASGTGATVDEAALPLAPTAAAPYAERLRAALSGGEDYVLLFTVPPARGAAVARRATIIGRLERRRGLRIRRRDGTVEPLSAEGFRHF